MIIDKSKIRRLTRCEIVVQQALLLVMPNKNAASDGCAADELVVRLPMRILLLICLLGLLGCDKVEKSEYLEASIANCKKIEPNVVIFDFVLQNNSKRSLYLYERWNSWGAYQWSINVEDANGDVWAFSNPQTKWTKNYPSTFEIAPSAKYIIKCIIYVGQAEPPVDRYIFTSLNKKSMNRFPLILTGRFTSIVDKSDSLNGMSPNWEGAISTKKVVVE